MPELKSKLDHLAELYQDPIYIEHDPIAIPHGFESRLDIEIIGLVSALLAWGRRQTILSKLQDLCERLEYEPARFVSQFDPNHARHVLRGFKHRTFNEQDAFWLFNNLSILLAKYKSIESCFAAHGAGKPDIGDAIEGFSNELLCASAGTPSRLRKHVARPSTGSACKRLCMFIRWMVRSGPFDFGLWTSFSPSQLILPLDVHSGTQARNIGLLNRNANDWKSALELTDACRDMCSEDPCKYDFALFGAGVYGGLDDFTVE